MNAPRRAPRRPIDGVLLLDKSPGMTSNAALQTVRRLLEAAKAGHTGTLDPLATGLLPLCFGEATKFAGELLDADKIYVATVRLGTTTDSGDRDGRVLESRPVDVTPVQVEAVLRQLTGRVWQVPPMHSALKRAGKPLYEYARQGITLDRAPRQVTIHRIELLRLDRDGISIAVDCSKGTYIRTLAEDIGSALGCGAHLAALRRTRIGNLREERALSLDQLAAMTSSERVSQLAPVDALLADLPRADIGAVDAGKIMRGQAIPWKDASGRWRAYSAARFIGLCDAGGDGWLRPRRLVTSAADTQTEVPPIS